MTAINQTPSNVESASVSGGSEGLDKPPHARSKELKPLTYLFFAETLLISGQHFLRSELMWNLKHTFLTGNYKQNVSKILSPKRRDNVTARQLKTRAK